MDKYYAIYSRIHGHHFRAFLIKGDKPSLFGRQIHNILDNRSLDALVRNVNHQWIMSAQVVETESKGKRKLHDVLADTEEEIVKLIQEVTEWK